MEIKEISNMPHKIPIHSMHCLDFGDMEPLALTFKDRDHLLLRTLLFLLLTDSKKRSDTQDCRLSKVESDVTNLTTSMKHMETQLG